MILGNVNFMGMLTFFWTFLDKYSVESDIISSIDPTGCWKLNLIIFYAQLVLEKNNGLQTSETFETVF